MIITEFMENGSLDTFLKVRLDEKRASVLSTVDFIHLCHKRIKSVESLNVRRSVENRENSFSRSNNHRQ